MTRAVMTVACLFLFGASVAIADDTLWTRRYDGQGSRDDLGRFVLVDQDDNVIVVGSVTGIGTGKDVGVIKYDSAGGLQWSTTVAGPGTSSDDPKGAALDPATGSIYVAAQTGSFPDHDIMILKLTSDGNVSWNRTWGGADSMPDVPAGIAVDAAGDAYVTGYTTTANGLTDFVTMKYRTGTGLPRWIKVRPGEGGGLDAATGIALGPDGSVWVTGWSARQYMEDYCTVRYDQANGTEDTAFFYNYSGNASDKATAITVDAAGNAYVTGNSASAPPPSGFNQYATIKYTAAGAQSWVKRYTGGRQNTAAAIAVGDSAVYVAGGSQGDSADYDYATVAYSLTGTELWVARYAGPAAKDDNAADVAVLPTGAILVTGTSLNADNEGDFYTLRYTATGTEEWATRLNSTSDNDDQAAAITFDSRSCPYVFGSSYNAANYDFMLVKYGPDVAITEPGSTVPGRTAMSLSPNPARGWTSMECPFAGVGPASVSVLGVDGRAVITRQFDLRAKGPARLDLAGVVPGVYVVRLEAGAHTATQKLVVNR